MKTVFNYRIASTSTESHPAHHRLWDNACKYLPYRNEHSVNPLNDVQRLLRSNEMLIPTIGGVITVLLLILGLGLGIPASYEGGLSSFEDDHVEQPKDKAPTEVDPNDLAPIPTESTSPSKQPNKPSAPKPSKEPEPAETTPAEQFHPVHP